MLSLKIFNLRFNIMYAIIQLIQIGIRLLKESVRLLKERADFNLDIILENSARYKLEDIAGVFEKETELPERQTSLKTLIIP